MSVALHGNLRDFGMAEVFQLVGQQRKTGVLQVRGAEREVELRFDGGGVVSAAPVGAYEDEALGEMAVRCGLLPRERLTEFERARATAGDRLEAHLLAAGVPIEPLREVEDLLTRETLFDLLRWDDGSFRFVAQPIAHDRPPASLLGAEQVLMDGLRMVDEWRAFIGEIPDDATVYRRRGGIEEYRRSPAARAATHPAEAERLFLLIDGRAPVRRVIDLSRLGTFLGVRILVDLQRSGWIEPVRSRASARAPGEGRGGSPLLRRRTATWGPLAGLALVAALALGGGGGGGGSTAPIRRDALADARMRYDAVRVRHLALAARLASGSDAPLDALPGWPDGEERALTRREADAYYLAQREGGAIVLAPER